MNREKEIPRLALHRYANYLNLEEFGGTNGIKQRNAGLARKMESNYPGIADIYAQSRRFF